MKKKLSEQEAKILAEHAFIMNAIYDEMAARGETLHEGQVKLAKAVFTEGKRVVQAQWGRSGGKTFTACLIAWIYAMLNPNSQIWIITPQRKQGKDIYWASNRIQRFGPAKFIAQLKETELRVVFKNGSVITIDGCENYQALRGIKPHLVIYDEFQHHSREFHLEVMQPNLSAKKAILVVLGTPPKRDCYYVQFNKELLDEIRSGDKTRDYFEFPSFVNPSIDPKELEKIKIRLIKSGDEKIWLREYMGQLIFGGEGAVFSPWSREKHIVTHSVIMSALESNRSQLKWYALLDPGNMSAFGVLFMAHNPYTSQLYLLDELYETNPRHTDCKSMWDRILYKETDLFPNHAPKTWKRIYDEAAQWFFINIKKMYPDSYLTPCEKNKIKGYSSREADTSIIKQIMASDNVFMVSDRCKNFIWEVENYVLNEDGTFPRDHDHLIDCLIYGIKACHYKFIEDAPKQDIKDSFNHNQTQQSKAIQSIKADEWADSVVADSLTIGSIYDEYFN